MPSGKASIEAASPESESDEMFRFNLRATIGMLAAGLVLAVAAGVHAKDATDHQAIAAAHATVASFKKADPTMAAFLERAPAYAVFPTIGKAGLGIGGAHGNGVVFQNGKPIGRTSVTQVSIGLQAGAQEYAEIVVFETPADLQRFTRGNFEFAAGISAVAVKTGVAQNARFSNGVAVFTGTKGGLMLEASVGGQKFGFEPFAR
jgi:lipid-binding SYLF domain-containing protein